jgi:hypothetical protein
MTEAELGQGWIARMNESIPSKGDTNYLLKIVSSWQNHSNHFHKR